MNFERLIAPIAIVGIVVAQAAIFGLVWGFGAALAWLFVAEIKLGTKDRRRRERERREYVREQTWKLGDRRLR